MVPTTSALLPDGGALMTVVGGVMATTVEGVFARQLHVRKMQTEWVPSVAIVESTKKELLGMATPIPTTAWPARLERTRLGMELPVLPSLAGPTSM